jgi:hypothetical protein
MCFLDAFTQQKKKKNFAAKKKISTPKRCARIDVPQEVREPFFWQQRSVCFFVAEQHTREYY